MANTYQRKPRASKTRRKRRCLKCGRMFPALGKVLPSGRWTWIEHTCRGCSETNKSASVGTRDETYSVGVSCW